jgi:hypothetical protein
MRSTVTDDYRHPPVHTNQDQAELIGDKVVKEFREEPNDNVIETTKSSPDGTTTQDSPVDNGYKTKEPTAQEASMDGSNPFTFEAPTPDYSTHHKHKVDMYNQAFVCIKRANSAKQPTVWDHHHSIENFEPLPNGNSGYGIHNPFTKNVLGNKFWL